jgi:predicted nucleic acid-binding protein
LIFIDTGAWCALKDPDDQYHEDALSFYEELRDGKFGTLITTDYVIDETSTLLMARKGIDLASTLLDEVLPSKKSIHLVWMNEQLFSSAVSMFKASGDKRWSLTDCTSFEVVRRMEINEAFAFDWHFTEAGFNRFPDVTTSLQRKGLKDWDSTKTIRYWRERRR